MRRQSSLKDLSSQAVDAKDPALPTVEPRGSDTLAVYFRQRPDLSLELAGDGLEQLTGRTIKVWRETPGCFWKTVLEEDAGEMGNYLASARNADGYVQTQFRLRHAVTGQIRYVLELRQALRDSHGMVTGYEGFWIDASRPHQNWERLRQAESSEILKRLVAGFVHDLNNAFLGLSSYASLAITELAADDPVQRYLAHIKTSTDRSVQVVEQLSKLLRQPKSNVDFHDLRSLADQVEQIARRALSRRIQLKFSNATEPLPVCTNADTVQRILLRLLLNAVDAIGPSGSISIQTERVDSPPDNLHWLGAEPIGPAACLSMIDSGAGWPFPWPPATAPAFPSSKPGRCGLGLGLSEATREVAALGGGLTFDTPSEGGARVRLWLPLSDFSEETFFEDHRIIGQDAILLLAFSEEEAKPWERHLHKAGFKRVVRTDRPLVLLSENREAYDALAIPWPRPEAEPDLIRMAKEVRLHRFPVRLIALCPQGRHAPPPEELFDLILSRESSGEQWKETWMAYALQSAEQSPPTWGKP